MEIGSIENKVIVVIGSAGELGKHFVKGLSEFGCALIAADINANANIEIYKDLSKDIELLHLDITNKESIQELISKISLSYSRIDAVVNAAYPRNKNYGAKLEDVSYEDFCQNINMHLGGYFLVAQQFCLEFKRQGFGNLVNLSSIYGSLVPRFSIYDGTKMTMPIEYAAIKAGVEHMTRYFAQYFKGTGVRVNSLSPGEYWPGNQMFFLRPIKVIAQQRVCWNPMIYYAP